MKKKNSGFTLVELLAVVVILAIVVTIATGSVIGIVNKSKENMSREIRASLKEAAISYVIDNFRLSICNQNISNEIYEQNNIQNLDLNTTTCAKAVHVETLLKEGLFEDSKGVCNKDDEIIVYHYSDGVNSDFKAYIDDTICKH